MNLYKIILIKEDEPVWRSNKEEVESKYINIAAKNIEDALSKAIDIRIEKYFGWRIINIKEVVTDVEV